MKANVADNGDDEWETDPDFVNDVSEKEQRWGAKTVEGSGHQASMKLDKLREEVSFPFFCQSGMQGWLHGSVVERRSLAGELFLSCARPVADW